MGRPARRGGAARRQGVVPGRRYEQPRPRGRPVRRGRRPHLAHVKDPLATLEEARRVLKPGGTVGIFDGDYASMTFGHEDPEKGRAHDEALIAARWSPSPASCGRCRECSVRLASSPSGPSPNVLAEVGRADFWAPAMTSFRTLLPKAGAMSAVDAAAWADDLEKASAEGVFFGASNFYSYVARRP